MVQEGHGVLAVVACGGTELIEDGGFGASGSERITRTDCTNILAARSWGHRGLRGDEVFDGSAR
jgi:hypothetical protein